MLTFEIVGRVTTHGTAHDFDGVVLKQWFSLGTTDDGDEAISISPHSKYGRAWSLAVGRSLKKGEAPEPQGFVGKTFRVIAGFSSRADGGYSLRNTYARKDSRDFIRVHELLENLTEKAQTHMKPHDNTVNVHVHVNEHEHQHDTRASAPTPTSTPAVASTLSVTDQPACRNSHGRFSPHERGTSTARASCERGVKALDAESRPTPRTSRDEILVPPTKR